jgi:hypothetical protein
MDIQTILKNFWEKKTIHKDTIIAIQNTTELRINLVKYVRNNRPWFIETILQNRGSGVKARIKEFGNITD